MNELELFALKKAEQVEILKGLGIKKIPRYEKDRVNLILAKQKQTKKPVVNINLSLSR